MKSFKKFLIFLIPLFLVFLIFYFLYTPLKTQFNFKRDVFLEFPKIESDYFAIFSFPELKLIYGKNIKEKYSLASITKLITAYIAFKSDQIQKEVLINQNDLLKFGVLGGLVPGKKVKIIDLVRIFLKNSSNPAAEIVFKNIDQKTKEEIFNELKNLGANFEIFDGSGLNLKNKGSILDLAILFKKIYEDYPQILEFSKENSDIYPLGDSNSYVLNLNGSYNGFLGGKVGTLPEIGFNFSGIFEIKGKKYLIVVFGAKDFFVELDKILKFLGEDNLFPFCNENSKVLGNYKRACKIKPVLNEKDYFEVSVGTVRLRIIKDGIVFREYYLKKLKRFSPLWAFDQGIYYLKNTDNKIYVENDKGKIIVLSSKEEKDADIQILANDEEFLEILNILKDIKKFLIFW
jgi:D-alanyl-D-alanine carboxypeptidase